MVTSIQKGENGINEISQICKKDFYIYYDNDFYKFCEI